MALPYLFRRILFRKFIFLILFFSTCLISILRFRPDDIENNVKSINYNIQQLLDLNSFEYLLKTEQCQNYEYGKPLLGILIVTSFVKNSNLRMAHRNALPQCRLGELGFQRIFLLGDIPPNEAPLRKSVLEHEQELFDDLLQGNFYDTLQNLTYKHIMGLRWASHECRRAKFIMVLDENVIYDVYYLKSYLTTLLKNKLNLNKSHHLLSGVVLMSSQSAHDQSSKWLAPPNEYLSVTYPYNISGYFYITNALTATRLVQETAKTTSDEIDDVWVVEVIKKYQLFTPLQSIFVSTQYSTALSMCCERFLIKFGFNCDHKVGISNIYETNTVVKFQKALEMCYYDNL